MVGAAVAYGTAYSALSAMKYAYQKHQTENIKKEYINCAQNDYQDLLTIEDKGIVNIAFKGRTTRPRATSLTV